jgi:hypothetical protein
MDRIVRRRLEMAVRVRDFSRAHPSADANYAPVLARLEDRVARLEAVAKQQQSGYLVRHASAVHRQGLRRKLRFELLQHLVTVAESAGRKEEGLADRYRVPKVNATNEAFRTLGRTMLERGQADKEVLAKYGLADRLLEDLAATLDQFDASVADTNEGRREHVGARAELKAVSDEVMGLVELLDGLNRYRFGGDAEMRAAWESARKVVTGPQLAEAPVVPAPGGEVKPAA